MNSLEKMYEYNLWANTKLIGICSQLDEKQLEIEGVFGRIQPTIVHLVRAEGGYLNRLSGSRPFAEDLDWDNMSMADLLANAQKSGEQLVSVASQADPSVRHDIEVDGQVRHYFNWTVILQALYHGIEHRTQIKVLLTELGVEHPDLAAWDYLESLLAD